MDRRDHALDWLTGLLPVTLMAFIGYRWQFVWLAVLAVGGYLMAALLLERLPGRERDAALLPRAFLAGALVPLCLPSAAPFWSAALGGGLLALAESVPPRVGRVPLPTLHPLVLPFLLLRLLIPGAVARGFALPLQWAGMDALSTATPLAALRGGETLHSAWQLLFGVRAGAMGEICVAAVLVGAVYLLLRRRLRLIAPACMLATVSLLSWLLWNSPLYGLLAGSVTLSALLLADRAYMPSRPALQIAAGIAAGVVTVLVRRFGGWTEGTAVGLLAAGLAVFLYPYVGRLVGRIPGAHRLFSHCKDIFWKKKNNG